MLEKPQIYDLLSNCIEELNKQLPSEKRITPDNDTLLLGPSSELDSLGVVTLFVSFEESLTNLGITLDLMDELLSYRDDHPFITVEGVVSWVESNS